jgi:hypothetical protein
MGRPNANDVKRRCVLAGTAGRADWRSGRLRVIFRPLQKKPAPLTMSAGLLTSLRERGVPRVAASYGVICWLVLQIADVTLDPLGLPKWIMTRADRRGRARLSDRRRPGLVLRGRRR